jgi:hypothetical protein
MLIDDFTPLFEALCAFANREPSEALAEAYWLGCSDLDADAWRSAVARWIRDGDGRMPAPRDLRQLGGEQSQEQRALTAWATVQQAIRRHGSYRSVDFEDPAINAAIRSMGGWVALCQRSGADFDTWAAKEFQRQHRAWSEMPNAEMARRLSGIAESTNLGRWETEVVIVPTLGTGEPETRRIEAPKPPTLGDGGLSELVAELVDAK